VPVNHVLAVEESPRASAGEVLEDRQHVHRFVPVEERVHEVGHPLLVLLLDAARDGERAEDVGRDGDGMDGLRRAILAVRPKTPGATGRFRAAKSRGGALPASLASGA
jgi:hypothetical protein